MKIQNHTHPNFASIRRLFAKLLFTLLVVLMASGNSRASTDYGPAVWRPACSGKWYSSGFGKRFFVIHDIEGYYLSAISYLQRCDVPASVHYVVNGKKDYASDANPGQVSQMVRDAYYAWHARCWNQYSMGTEHEGFASNPAWFTEAMYQASGALTAAKCSKYGIAKDRNHVIAHGQKLKAGWTSWMTSHGYSYSFATCNDHSDPGPHWNWSHFMNIVEGGPAKPKRPTQLKATVVSWQRIELKWTDNADNENHFEIQKSSTSNNGPWNSIHNNGENDRNYTVSDLSGNNKYWFRVRAYNGAGNSDWSNVTSATTDNRYPPSDPANLVAVANNDDKITLTWNDTSSNEDGFKIFRSSDGTNFSRIDIIGVNRESYVDTDLRGNRKYWYKICAYNTSKEVNSGFSNKASDTTGPTAPSNLDAVKGATWDSAKLTWTDNSGAEVGFKIERGTSASGPFTQIATNAASDRTYTDTGLAGTTTYHYRVRSYNANANSLYSNTDAVTTGNSPPVLSAIGNKTVAAGGTLSVLTSATDPNQNVVTTSVYGFQVASVPSADGTVMFRSPKHSATTDNFIDGTVTNYSKAVDTQPSGNGSTKAFKAQWTFKTGQANQWVRLTTANAQTKPNPVIDLNHSLRLKIYSSKAIKVGLGIRETTNNPAVGGDGGTTGDLEWVGVTNIVGGAPMPTRAVAANVWTTLTFNCQKNPAQPFTGGDGKIKLSRGVLEHLAIVRDTGTGQHTIYVDDIDVLENNTLDFTLDAGAPAGLTIGKKSGELSWVPTSGQVGNHKVTIRVTDQLGAEDFETITITVTGAGNNPPTLSAIGNKTGKEGTAITFTATGTDPDAGQTKTFSLDAGAPSGATINPSSGAFSWTPSESQGGGTYPITVRVTDNGSPSASDSETITVTVDEVNNAPTLSAIATQTVNENQTLNVTPSASDSDLPAQTLTYSLLVAPSGMTINTNTGALSWTPTEDDGPDTNQVTIRVTDNGSPKLFAERTFDIVITDGNIAPVLTVPSTSSTLAMLADFENYEADTYNGTIMFRQPSYSGTTSPFLNATPDDITISTNAPGENGSSVLAASWSFATGTSNPWLRLTTFSLVTNTYSLPNPTIDLTKHVKFDIYSDKQIQVALGVRETGTSAPLGTDGGTTGALEWIGVSGKNGSTPIPTRTIPANTWTTLDFDLPNEVITAFTGDGNLAGGKGVLEHIVIVPGGGMGLYNVSIDNFEILTAITNLTVNTGEEIVLACTATDADQPGQNLTFSLDAGAPTNATINEAGVFSWTPTPEQSPSTNVITIRVTDDGIPALSDAESITIKVKKVNTAPFLEHPGNLVLEQNSSQTISFTASAFDDDIPADTLTFTLTGTIPSGATINSTTGDFNWTPPTSTLGVTFVTIRVTDNGSPSLFTEQQFSVTVVSANTAPSLSLGAARITEPFAHFETFANNTANDTVMFRRPSNSSTTTNFLTTATNYTIVTTNFPTGNAKSGAKVLKAGWTFKTGIANYWVRLTTFNAANLPNPTVDLGARVKLDIHTSKSLKVGIGIRETGTSAQIGANGGTTGGIEWVGVPAKNGSSPNPSRVVNANTWTTLEFDLPVEAVTNFSGGNSVLASGKGVLEHLALVGNGGTGAYTVYIDNFEVVTTAALPGTVTVKANSELSFTASATDPNPGNGLGFGLDADILETTTATIDSVTGAFLWTPTIAGTTNAITVTVNDDPADGSTKSDSETFTVITVSDSVAPQSADAGQFVAGGDSIDLTWDSTPGATYKVQTKSSGGDWVDAETVTATGETSSVAINNDGTDTYVRVVEANGGAASE